MYDFTMCLGYNRDLEKNVRHRIDLDLLETITFKNTLCFVTDSFQ